MTTKKKNRVLAIDDEPAMIEWLKILLEHEGYEVRTAMIGTRGEEIFKTWKPDVVVTDMMLPDADGLELLRKFKQTHADTEVIVITGHGSVPKAVEAMKAGAHSFVEKPIEPDTLLAMLERAIERRDLVGENLLLKQKLEGQFRFGNIIGKSRKMHEVLELVAAMPISSFRARTAPARNSSPTRFITTASARRGRSSRSTARRSRRT
jgi:two-component system NtrC family response regulator